MPIKQKFIHILPIVLILFLGILFDDVKGVRLLLLLGLSGLIILQHVIRSFGTKVKDVEFTFIAEIALLILLESQSRYVVNYFFHIGYLIVIMEMAFSVKGMRWYLLAVTAVVASMLKYAYLLSVTLSIGNIAQTAFLGLVGISIVVSLTLVKQIDAQRIEKDELYKELLKTHKQLKVYSDQVKELAALEERTRLAREIHDSLGHDMMATIMSLELAQRINTDAEVKNIIEEAKVSVKKGLNEIRNVVSALRLHHEITKISDIEDLITSFETKSGIKINTTIDMHDATISEEVIITLLRIVQESLTNMGKHAKASHAQIIIINEEAGIVFNITDNGIGCTAPQGGFGLKGITERVESHGGTVTFDGEKGFVIKGILPTGGSHD